MIRASSIKIRRTYSWSCANNVYAVKSILKLSVPTFLLIETCKYFNSIVETLK